MACHATKENDVCIVNLEYTLTVMSGEQQHFEEKKKTDPNPNFFFVPNGVGASKGFSSAVSLFL